MKTLSLALLLLGLAISTARAQVSEEWVARYASATPHSDVPYAMTVDAAGYVNIALIGPVAARGLTAAALAQAIAARLREGYIREPHVSVEVEAYRPFYILGEVNNPGQYEYQNGMTVTNAVALAGGYTYRAKESEATIERGGCAIEAEPDTAVLPGEVITVPERYI